MRLWQVHFQVFKAIPGLPVLYELVEEIQNSSVYYLEGKNRTSSEAQLVYTKRGEGAFRHKNKVYPLLPGTAFFAKVNDPETAYYYPPHAKEPWIFLWVAFTYHDESLIDNIINRYGYVYELPDNRGIVKKMESYKSLRGTSQTMTPVASAQLVMDVFSSIEEAAIQNANNKSQNNFINNVQDYIMENLGGELTVSGMAEHFSISREHLSRIFKEHTGLQLQDYILRQKMRLACSLLNTTSFTCKEIASRAGYENPASFSRAFKAMTGTTPEAVRKTGMTPAF